MVTVAFRVRNSFVLGARPNQRLGSASTTNRRIACSGRTLSAMSNRAVAPSSCVMWLLVAPQAVNCAFDGAALGEAVQVVENVGTCGKIKALVSHAPVVDMMKTCFKRRPFGERRILWCLVVILMFTIFALNGTSNIFYLFTREKFQWTLRQATMFDSISLVISLFGCLIGIVFLKKLLNISDLTLAAIAIVSMIVDSLIKAFAQSPTTMYFASAVSLFKILSSPMCRSLISSIIPNNETGKVYSIASSFEAVSSLVASPLYTFIYAKTFTFFAGAFYLITAGVYIINLILAYSVFRLKRTRENLMNPYSQIDNS